MTPVARLTWLFAAIALASTDPSQAQTTKRPQCEVVGTWRVCQSAILLNYSKEAVTSNLIERNGEKIGGMVVIEIGLAKSQLEGKLVIAFHQGERKDRARIIADGIVVDTIEQSGGRYFRYDLKPRFGDELQWLRSGDADAKRPPVSNLKVVMAIDGEDLTIFDATLTDTDKALQRHLAMATPAGPNPSGKQAAKPQERTGNEHEAARKTDEPHAAAPRPPAVAVPASLDECKSIPDALEQRFRSSGQQIDHLYFYGRGRLMDACARSQFVEAQQFALELLRRHRTTRRPQVQLYRDLAKTIPMPHSRENCKSLWERVRAYVRVDEIDGEEAVSDPVLRACAAGDMDSAHKRMVNHVNIEVKAALDRYSQPSEAYGALPKPR